MFDWLRKKGEFEREGERQVAGGRDADRILRAMDRTTKRMHRDTDSVMDAANKSHERIIDREYEISPTRDRDSHMERVEMMRDNRQDARIMAKPSQGGGGSAGPSVDFSRGEGVSFNDWWGRVGRRLPRDKYGAEIMMNNVNSGDFGDIMGNQDARSYIMSTSGGFGWKRKNVGYVGKYNPKILDSSMGYGSKFDFLHESIVQEEDKAMMNQGLYNERYGVTEQPVNLPKTPDVTTPPDRERLDDEIGSFMTDAVQNARSNMQQFQNRGGMFMFPEAARPQETSRRPDEDRNQMLQMMMMQNLGMYQPQYPVHWGARRRRW